MNAARLVLWRHGRTAYNQGNRWQGQLDVPMDAVGRDQAAAAAALLTSSFGPGPVVVVSSDLARASATAAALGLPVTLDPGLREIFAGEWQGLRRSEIVERWPDEFTAWRRGDDVRPGGGESRSEASSRTALAVTRALASCPEGATLVVAGHGASLRGAMALLLGLPAEAWTSFGVLGNARWADLRRRGDRWALAEYNAGASRFGDPPEEQGRLAEPLKEGAAGL